jgi:hypothetical protein
MREGASEAGAMGLLVLTWAGLTPADAVPLPRSIPDADRSVIYEFAMDRSDWRTPLEADKTTRRF